MSKGRVSPVIRFTHFSKNWEENTLGDLAYNFEYGLNASAKEYDGENKYIRITDIDDSSRYFSQSSLTSPDININNSSKYILEKGDILFARTGASVGKSYLYKNSDGKVFYAGFLIRIKANDNSNAGFIFQNTHTNDYEKFVKVTSQRSGQPGINAKEYAKYKLYVPVLDEQTKIANYFNQIDKIISLRQHELTLLEQRKKAFLQKMYPKKGESIPEMRFPEFENDWKLKKIEDLITQVVREVPKPDKPYGRLSIRSHAKGTFHKFVEDPSSVAMNKLYVVKENDLIVNITFAWEHAIAIAKKKDNGKLVSHRFPTFLVDKSDVNFMQYIILKESFRQKLELISPGGAGRNRVLNKKDFVKLKIFVPIDLVEQQKIGQFFKQLDEEIKLHEQKLEKLKEMKKAFLQKMFV